MKQETFTYITHEFKLLGVLPKNFDFFEVTRQCRSIGISNYRGGNYSHEEFYKQAGKIGAKEIDIFLMNELTVVLPCENELFEYLGKWKVTEGNSILYLICFWLFVG